MKIVFSVRRLLRDSSRSSVSIRQLTKNVNEITFRIHTYMTVDFSRSHNANRFLSKKKQKKTKKTKRRKRPLCSARLTSLPRFAAIFFQNVLLKCFVFHFPFYARNTPLYYNQKLWLLLSAGTRAQYRSLRSFIRENRAFCVYLVAVPPSLTSLFLFLLHSNSPFFFALFDMYRPIAFSMRNSSFINFSIQE